MMHQRTHFFALVAAACALCVLGCTRSGAPTLKTEYVEGVVTLDGKPVEGATVTFHPVDPDSGVSATGVTDAQGKYTLTAAGPGGRKGQPGAGTVPGEYYVTVYKAEVPGTEAEPEEKEGEFPPEEEEGKPEETEPEVKHLIPAKYADPKTSGLKVTVKEGENNIPIELTSE